MATAQGGTPVALSFPANGGMEAKWRDMFVFNSPAADVASTDYWLSEIIIEPLTGFIISGSLKLQHPAPRGNRGASRTSPRPPRGVGATVFAAPPRPPPRRRRDRPRGVDATTPAASTRGARP